MNIVVETSIACYFVLYRVYINIVVDIGVQNTLAIIDRYRCEKYEGISESTYEIQYVNVKTYNITVMEGTYTTNNC